MGTDEISAAEAAKLLGVDLRTLRTMARRGLIQPLPTSRGTTLVFSIHDVATLIELRGQKLDLAAVTSLAMRAYVASKSNERRLALISDLLGLNRTTLETDEAGVVSLFLEAQDTDPLTVHSPEALRRWASILFSIDEAYLRIVEHHTGSPEPWRPFFGLAQGISAAPGPRGLRRKEVEAAFLYLDTARRHLRTVMYVYYREKYGIRAADRAFPEMEPRGVDAELAAILYPA